MLMNTKCRKGKLFCTLFIYNNFSIMSLLFTVLRGLILSAKLPSPLSWEADIEAVHREIDLINSMNLPWKAEVNYMSYFSDDEIKRRLGLRRRRKHKSGSTLLTAIHDRTKKAFIPKNFDIRHAWPNCTVMNSVKDQGSCGSCWALSVASCFADRVCVATNGFLNRNLSTEELVTCCKPCTNGGDGCQGGYLDSALEYIYLNGIVTGGDYNSNEGCKPYSVAPCGINNCAPFTMADQCRKKCTNCKYYSKYENDRFFGGPPEKLINDEEKVQLSILKKGSVIASFTMYSDLVNYKSGVYKHVAGRQIGSHAVRVLGWGVENGEEYWLAVNSWNMSWGLDGRFKISRHHHNCDFGDFVAPTVDIFNL